MQMYINKLIIAKVESGFTGDRGLDLMQSRGGKQKRNVISNDFFFFLS